MLLLPDTSSRLRDRATCLLQAGPAPALLQNVDTDTVSSLYTVSLYSLYTVDTFPLDVVKGFMSAEQSRAGLAGEWDQLEECWQQQQQAAS